MPSSYTPTAQYTGSDPTVPADGDAATVASVNTPFGVAFDRLALLRAATDGLLVWGRRARVAVGGARDGAFKVYCPPIEAVTLLDGATWKSFALAAETELTSAAHFGGGTLANDTFYYVYACVVAGALSFEVSTTVPDGPLTWKTGAAGTHRYLFCFRTSSTGVPLPMRMSSGLYTYRRSAIGDVALCAVEGNATSWTTVSLAALVPPHVFSARVELVAGSAGTAGSAQLRTPGDTAGSYAVTVTTAALSTSRVVLDLETDSARAVEYRVSHASIAAQLFAHGFSE